LKPKFEIKKIAQARSIATIVALLAITATSMVTSRALAAGAEEATKTNRGPDGEPVELRIKELHDKLKITDAQEELWTKVTKEMRDHAKATQDMIGTRNQNATQMTAIDDLKSYADIAQLHADGMKQFLTVFSPLYTAMTDTQKKNADDVFREHKDGRAKKHQKQLGLKPQ
jgi:periplasmic protein CpxP/Spy